MKGALIITALLALAGCAKQAEHAERAGAEFVVETLFTKDGCTVYRFHDYGNARYFTNCKGSTEWRESCGKNCTRQTGVPGA